MRGSIPSALALLLMVRDDAGAPRSLLWGLWARRDHALRVLTSACLCLLASTACHAQSPVADFYAGRNVDFIIGYAPGGGFDLYGRALAQHMGRHIPGKPNVVVKNMPGAASLKALQYISDQAPRDGSVLGLINSSLVNLAVLDPAQVNVDISRLTLIGNMSSDVKACFAWTTTGIRTLDDVKRRGSVLGGTAQGSEAVYGAILKRMLGDKLKIVLGYPTGTDIWLAMERGEVEGNCTGWGIVATMRPDWITDKKVNVFVQFARKASPDLPDVPLIGDSDASADLKAATNFISLADQFPRPIIAPPNVPDDRAKALRDAMQATLRDSEFLADARRAKLDIIPMDAGTLTRLVQEVLETPKPAVEIARDLLK